eukprot:768277-Hanusia_phi.AAC.1
MEEELTQWVLGEVDPDHLADLYGMDEQEALDLAMCTCCLFGLGNAVSFLLEQGARIDAPLLELGPIILHNLARKRGISVQESDLQGSTALHMSALCGHPELVEVLCKLGADPTRRNLHGDRPSMLISSCSTSNCICISNKVWSFGCRTSRTRRIIKAAEVRQQLFGISNVFSVIIDGIERVFPEIFDYLAPLTFFQSSFLNLDSDDQDSLFDKAVHKKSARRSKDKLQAQREKGINWNPVLSFLVLLAGFVMYIGNSNAALDDVETWLNPTTFPTCAHCFLFVVVIAGYRCVGALSPASSADDEVDLNTLNALREDYYNYSQQHCNVKSGCTCEIEKAQSFGADSNGSVPQAILRQQTNHSKAQLNSVPVAPPTSSNAPSPPNTKNDKAEKEADRRIAQLESQLQKADSNFKAMEYDDALKIYSEIASGVLRWLNHEKFEEVRSRQRDCSLEIAKRNACEARYVQAVKWFIETLVEYSESMRYEQILELRLGRDNSILMHLATSTDSESCADLYSYLQRLTDVHRPVSVTSQTWAAWKKKDKHIFSPLLEARIEQIRDSRVGSPVLLAGMAKYEAALKTCEKMGDSDIVAMQDLDDINVQILIWMAEAGFTTCSVGHSDSCIADCQKAICHIESASSLLRQQMERDPAVNGSLRQNKIGQCDEIKSKLEETLARQFALKERDAEEALKIEKALEEQRRLDEEARALKRAQAEERQRKAREEKLRKEQERKVQQAQEKEEAIRKKAEAQKFL